MNKILKTLLQNKLITITISVFVLLFLILAFFSNKTEKEANSVSDNDGTSSSTIIENNESLPSNAIFSTYEEYNGGALKLFKCDSIFKFVDSNNSVVYSTEDSIDYFRVINNDTLIYICSSLNYSTNTNLSEIKYINLKSKEEKILFSAEKLFFELANDVIFIVDGKSGNVIIGDATTGELDSSSKYSINSKISDVIENKGKIFAVNISAINGVIKSSVYLLNENSFEKIIQCAGKVQNINVDYNNDNLIYYMTETKNSSTKKTEYVVTKKYLVNLSPSIKSEEVLSWLNSNVISLKDKYVCVDYSTNDIYLLNNNLSVNYTLGKLHSNSLRSLVKESSDGSYLYYLNTKGVIAKL